MLKELDCVALTRDVPEHGLTAGDVGTIVLMHGDRGYEVEFTSLDGETLAIVSLEPQSVRPIGRREIAQARVVRIPADRACRNQNRGSPLAVHDAADDEADN
jgi:Domain of unknown function (DUF4926)